MILFVVCVVFWLLLSGHGDVLHVLLGVGAAAAVARWNRHDEAVSPLVRALPRLARYAPWLLGQVVRANLQVARIVLDPALPVDPVVVRVRAVATGDLALTTLANSITLTPGTVTLDVDGGELTVHALTSGGDAELRRGAMAARVAAVYGEARA